jgi:ankyrin repeat protein
MVAATRDDASQAGVAMVRLLLERGAPINDRDEKGWTALHAASAVGNSATAQALLQAGADPTIRFCGDSSHFCFTPAETATQRGHHQLAERLQEAAERLSDERWNKWRKSTILKIISTSVMPSLF